ncbi:exodeoxyribonuclease V subunit alpha [Enemella sp. A6]|uniref:exodeoxyribonuclease V subunit alpha n=1 Tax=Enemella sp. A6 TaxID=3440152 RepID=UPI003EBECF3D
MGILTDTPISEADAAVGAPPLLAEFAEAGVLGHADIRVAMRFGQLLDETNEPVLLALALTVRALQQGSVCLDLTTVADTPFDLNEGFSSDALPWPEPGAWSAAVEASPLTTLGPDADEGPRPLRQVDGLLYLERYWLQEEAIRRRLVEYRRAAPPSVDEGVLSEGLAALFTREGLAEDEVDRQQVAAILSNSDWLTVIAGGPGTGKTSTVAKLLALMYAQAPEPPRVALAAPTGKAAARLSEAVADSVAGLPEPWRGLVPPLRAVTLHSLLQIWGPFSSARRDELNPLPYDIVIVDETSMMSLSLTDTLLRAVRPPAEDGTGTRLVLIGDPNQLTSVEAGAVLADICTAERAPSARLSSLIERVAPREAALLGSVSGQVVELTHTWRFRGRLQEVAEAIRVSDADRVIDLLTAPVADPVADNARLIETDVSSTIPEEVRDHVVTAGQALHLAAEAGDAAGALQALEQYRVLCAHRHGPHGVSRWGREIESWLGLRHGDGEWYLGRPVMVTRNDRDFGLFNGDTGVVIATEDGPRVVFEADGTRWAPTLLDDLATVHAMTIHKAQGSQFGRVAVILPPTDSPVLTKELLYTAVTRAARAVDVIGTAEAVRIAVGRPANRASGLRRRLEEQH